MGPAGGPRTPPRCFARWPGGSATARAAWPTPWSGRRPAPYVGTTSLGRIDATHRNLEIGWTAYTPTVWGTGVNTVAKYLLLGHAFDDCGMERVQLRVDSRNARSAASVRRLGAHLDGTMRRDRLRPDGVWRDSLVFSVLRDEWPDISARLATAVGPW